MNCESVVAKETVSLNAPGITKKNYDDDKNDTLGNGDKTDDDFERDGEKR